MRNVAPTWPMLGLFFGLTVGCSSPPRPDVIIVVIDALRADHLSCEGYQRDTTPAIDRFAEDSVRFSQAISQSTFTGCSIASLFTGRFPHHHGLYWGSLTDTGKATSYSHVLGEIEVTLAETLRKHGYDTGAWFQNRMLRQGLGFDQGFDLYQERLGPKQGSVAKLSSQFFAWTAAPGRDHEFFAYLHFLDLHDPYLPPPPFDTRYGSFADVYSEKDLSNWGAFLHAVEEGRRELSKAELDQLIALYDGQLRSIDNEIGSLFRQLQDANLYERSLIVLTSDHGDGFMEHGFLGHGRAPYEELCRVPLIIKFPNQQNAGEVVASQVRLIDIMPTVLDVIGINDDKQPSTDGASLVPLVGGHRRFLVRKARNHPAITEILLGGDRLTVAVRDGRYKFIMGKERPDEFYDLERDPGETINLSGSRSYAEKRLREQALRVIEEGSQGLSSKVPVDSKTLEELKALGYVQ